MYKYKYADLDCDYCLYTKQCVFAVCPFIMECLDDLRLDKAFQEAVDTADTCGNKHRQTLLMLKNTHLKEVYNG